MTTMRIDNHGYLYGIRHYRGYVIQSFDNAQLHDTDYTDVTYAVYVNEDAYAAGVRMHVGELDKLWQAKAFIDATIQKGDVRPDGTRV